LKKTVIWYNHFFSEINKVFSEYKKNHAHLEVVFSSKSSSKKGDFDFYTQEPDLSVYDNFEDKQRAYISFCIDTINKFKVSFFMPFSFLKYIYGKEEYIQSQLNHTCEIIKPVNNQELFDKIDNKYENYEFLKRFNENEVLKFPFYEKATTPSDFANKYEKLRDIAKSNVVCCKPSVGVFGLGFKKLHENASKEDKFKWSLSDKTFHNVGYNEFVEILPDSFKELILMDYLNKDEYSVDCVCKDGEIKSYNIRKKVSSSKQVIIEDDVILNQCIRIAKIYKFNGFINLQFMEDNDGIPNLLEINPRMSGGVMKGQSMGGNDLVSAFVQNCLVK